MRWMIVGLDTGEVKIFRFPEGSTEPNEIAAYRPHREDVTGIGLIADAANCMTHGTVRSVVDGLARRGTLCRHCVPRQAAPSSPRAERRAVGHSRRRLRLVAFVPRISIFFQSCVGAARVPTTVCMTP